MRNRAFRQAAAALAMALAAALAACQGPTANTQANVDPRGTIHLDLSKRAPQDEIIYFMLPDRFANGDPGNDRGGLTGDRFTTGFDPLDPRFYQGGDLKGLTSKLDYIQALGATAIWLGPVFKNRPVQGHGADATAGYHGYWITDFLAVDPHLGTNADMKAFVDAAHARGMKVYLDVILNHTADIIAYRECPHDPPSGAPPKLCPYRSIADYPWTRKGGLAGEPINDGFRGDSPAEQTAENFAKLTRMDYAYTPYLPPGMENARNPAWLNDIRHYHNRGDTTFVGENSQYGDFGGLDDLMTSHPTVVQGMIDIFKFWISEYRIDGFRIDTIKHAKPELWRAFLPAMANHARSLGIDNFYMFGEAYDFDPEALARYTRQDAMPAALDFAFQGTVADVVIHGKSARAFEKLFAADEIYADGPRTAAILPTFLSNHDMGRFAGFLRIAHPKMSEAEKLQRLKLANAMLMFSRGVPVIYSGDEQGFSSDSNDRHARETLFASQVASWNDNDLVGSDRTNAQDNYDTNHPLFRAIAQMSAMRRAERTLRRGEQILRHADEKGGVHVLSRIDRAAGEEIVIAFNSEAQPRTLNIVVEPDSKTWTALHGVCAPQSNATTSYAISIPALDFVVCKSKRTP
jgi:glycosidase